jgi:hypothetical protein
VFNLVYESNTASTKIWDSLGFKRIGRVPGCGNLKSSPDPVDAIIYGKDLKSEGENDQSEERFDKIRYYLRHQLYPQGADRSEKSRLRSAATHYKLIGGEDGVPEKLYLKDKEVISDPQAQYEIANQIHFEGHGGINKTTAMIATKYHWIRIKETVSHVIKKCPQCKDAHKAPMIRTDNRPGRSKTIDEAPLILPQEQPLPEPQPTPHDSLTVNGVPDHDFASIQQPMDLANNHLPDPDGHLDPNAHLHPYDEMAIDPQIMEQIQAMASEYDQNAHAYVEAGMAPFVDPPGLQPHHHDPHDFNNHTPDHQFMHDTNPPLMGHDHVMNETDPNTGLNMQPMQHVLPMDYIDPSNNQQYKLEQ